MKAEADIHFLQGINQLIGHGWGYTPPGVEYPGWRFYAAGAYSEQNPWWIVMPDLASYLQRLSYLLRQGKPHNDVALYMPTADAYAHFSAGRVHLIETDRELVGEKIMPAIFEAGYNLDFFDDEVLKTVGRVEKKSLVLGASKHRVVVLPGIERMPLESLRKIDEFVKNGGILIATRRMPSMAPGLKTTEAEQAEFKARVASLFDKSNPTVRFVEKDEDVATALRVLLRPDAEISPSGKDFGFVHRQLEGSDIYFVANTSNQKKKVEITFRTGRVGAQIWNSTNGKTLPAVLTNKNTGSMTLALEFEPYESHVVVFSDERTNVLKTPGPGIAASSVDLSSDWRVSFGQGMSKEMPTLRSWTEDAATRYFSGSANYVKSVEVPANFIEGGRSVFLDFGEGQFIEPIPMRNGMRAWLDPPIREAAVIYLNGERTGSLWCPPYKLDVTRFLKAGRNDIRIQVANTAVNYMSGRKLPDYKLLNLRYGERFQPQDMDKIEPITSGLIGKVKLVSIK